MLSIEVIRPNRSSASRFDQSMQWFSTYISILFLYILSWICANLLEQVRRVGALLCSFYLFKCRFIRYFLVHWTASSLFLTLSLPLAFSIYFWCSIYQSIYLSHFFFSFLFRKDRSCFCWQWSCRQASISRQEFSAEVVDIIVTLHALDVICWSRYRSGCYRNPETNCKTFAKCNRLRRLGAVGSHNKSWLNWSVETDTTLNDR